MKRKKRTVLIVDGYNMIGDWPELQQLKYRDFATARNELIDMLVEYGNYTKMRIIVVFDAHLQKGGRSYMIDRSTVEVIYTREKETADEHIERLISQLQDIRTDVIVATSDYTEQRVAFAQGALRKSARELRADLAQTKREIQGDMKEYHKGQTIRQTSELKKRELPVSKEVWEQLERMRRGK